MNSMCYHTCKRSTQRGWYSSIKWSTVWHSSWLSQWFATKDKQNHNNCFDHCETDWSRQLILNCGCGSLYIWILIISTYLDLSLASVSRHVHGHYFYVTTYLGRYISKKRQWYWCCDLCENYKIVNFIDLRTYISISVVK